MESFIREYQIDDVSICDGLIDFFREGLLRQLTGPGVIGANGLVDPSFKKSTDLHFSAIEKLGVPASTYRLDAYMAVLGSFVEHYLDDLKINEHGGTFVLRYPPQIQWYQPGEGFYAWHADGVQALCDRALVITSYLNDVTDGGGTEFFHQQHTVEARKGRTAIFPAALTHVHRGVVSPTQEKYLVTAWLYWEK